MDTLLKEKANKYHTITARLTQDEYEELRLKAKKLGLTNFANLTRFALMYFIQNYKAG